VLPIRQLISTFYVCIFQSPEYDYVRYTLYIFSRKRLLRAVWEYLANKPNVLFIFHRNFKKYQHNFFGLINYNNFS